MNKSLDSLDNSDFFQATTDGLHPNSKESIKTADLVIVDIEKLHPLILQPTLKKYVSDLWKRRGYLFEDARLRAFRTTRNYRLWRFWLIAEPALNAALYGMLFGYLLKTSRGIDNFVGYLFLGITFFTILSRLMTAGSGLVATQSKYTRTFSLPTAAAVLVMAIRYALDSLVPAAVGVIVALIFQFREPLSWTILFVFPILMLLILFGTGLMFLVARITAFIPDFKLLVDLFARAWMFLSGIFFSIERFISEPEIYRLMILNPAHQFLEAIRNSVLYGVAPDLKAWLVMLAWSFGSLLIGFIFFWKAEEKYVRVS